MNYLMDRYEVLLFDAYGVLVHSEGAMHGAAAVIDYLNATGKPYFILTNDASKLAANAVKRYAGFGLHLDEHHIINSGQLLKPYFETHRLAGSRCVVLGPPDSERYVEAAGGRVVARHEPFDVLVLADETGYPLLETLDDMLSRLFERIDDDHTVHLVLPNPDLVYPKGHNRYGVAAGSLALLIEAALKQRYPRRPGLVFDRLGKPFSALFQEALRRSGTQSMVMIGDQLETDIRGARDFGLASALMAGGISRDKEVMAPEPDYLLRALTVTPGRPPA